MNPAATTILQRHDAGQNVATIAAACLVSPGYVYGILRTFRPQRSRQPRTRTSERRKLILGLLGAGIGPRRVAFLAGCSAAYVYRLKEESRSVAVTNGEQ